MTITNESPQVVSEPIIATPSLVRRDRNAAVGRWAFRVLWLIPPLFIAVFICRFVVDVPAWDDFSFGDTLHNMVVNGLSLKQLCAQHNESRPAFPRLLMYFLYGPTQWDLRYMIGASFVVVLATAALMSRICRGTISSPTLARGLALFVCFMIFSPVQWDNFLWAIQLIVFVPLLALVVITLSLRSRAALPVAIAIAALSAVVSTYSNSNGMLVWVLAVPFFVVHPSSARWRGLGAWLVLMCVFVGFYFHGYVKPAGHPEMSSAFHDLKGASLYLLAFLGNGLRICKDPDLDARLGGIAVAVWGIGSAAVLAFGRRNQMLHRAMPWMVFGLYSLSSALLTTVGRYGFGPIAGIAERYCTFAIPLWISIPPLWTILFLQFSRPRSALRVILSVISIGIGGAVAVLMIQGCLYVRAELFKYESLLLAGRSASQFALVAPDHSAIEATIFPVAAYSNSIIDYADKADEYHPQCYHSSDIAGIAASNNGHLSGYFDTLTQQDGQLVLSGWACIPTHMASVDAVLLTSPDAAGVERVFAIVWDDRITRLDVQKVLKDRRLSQTGWTRVLPLDQLVHGTRISAWAYDSYNRRAYRLGGSHDVP
jgi:hypothetical protein